MTASYDSHQPLRYSRALVLGRAGGRLRGDQAG
jgi:hypothetical protein